MTRADLLCALFGADPGLSIDGPIITGKAALLSTGTEIHVLGVSDGVAVGVEHALALTAALLQILNAGDGLPVLVMIDTASQRMSRRDELLGLNEYLGHVAKSLLLAPRLGHRTLGLIYGGSAAGALIATGLACETLLALPGAHPEVMDLPSMARVTKLKLELLEAMAKDAPVFAPGLDNLASTGAIIQVLDPQVPLAQQLVEALAKAPTSEERSRLGAVRGGRNAALRIADAVLASVLDHA